MTKTDTASVAKQNEDLIIGLYEALKVGDIEAFFAGCSEDIVLHEATSLSIGGTYQGRQHILECLATIIPIYDFTTLKIERLLSNYEFVAVLATFSTKASTPYKVAVSEWWRIENRKVVELRPFYWDTAELSENLR